MKVLKLLALPFAVGLVFANANAQADDAQVIANLKDSRISLLEGIAQAEKTSGPVISAKFEMDDNNKLSLSIYTAPKGLNTPAENNDLTELSGDPTVAPFTPQAEVFKDKEHVARASVHLTVAQLSKFTLAQVILKAQQAAQGGIPYSAANPMVRNGKPIVDVYFADNYGKGSKVTVNVQTGAIE